MEMTKEDDFKKALAMEEVEVKRMCEHILKVKPDNNRVARATGATIVNRPEELQESDVGTNLGLFEVRKIGDDYFTFLTECKEPNACSIILRGASKDVLNEIERNLQDALGVARNVLLNPKLAPGGGALEMELACRLMEKANELPS